MLYHASQTPQLTVLEPRVSNQGEPLVWLSQKRENVLVYLSNAVERHCIETGFAHIEPWTKWGPYGFTKDGRMELSEYYPNALAETYAGVSGYVYRTEEPDGAESFGIPFAAAYRCPVPVIDAEYVPDALEALLEAERKEEIVIVRYAELPKRMHDWLARVIPQEYAEGKADYRHFLKAKFPALCGDKQ